MRRMYSKKQVEQIAQNAVSSGTKLYRHYITNEGETYVVIIITTNNTPYSLNTLNIDMNADILIMYVFDDNPSKWFNCSTVEIDLNGKEISYVPFGEDTESTFTTEDNLTDTITEL